MRIVGHRLSILILIFINLLSQPILAQEITLDNYSGLWEDAGSWLVGPPANPYNKSKGTVTIRGNIASNNDLVFEQGTFIINSKDTLIHNGDLILGDKTDLNIEDQAILVIYGDMSVAKQADITNSGFLVVSGNLTFSGNGKKGSFISTQNPSQVFVGGRVIPPKKVNYNNFPLLRCGTGSYTNTNCNYGNMIDAGESPIGNLLKSSCSAVPNITAIGSNGPVAVGSAINFSSNGNPGTGTWPITYAWTGPLGYSASGTYPIRNSVTVDMTGYYVLTLTNNEGCSIKDSTYVDVLTSTCCIGSAYVSKNNYTGDWADINSWATPNEAWRPLPPPVNPMNSQPLCINGYITLNGNLSLNGGTMKICDTLVITGDLYLQNPTLVIEPTGLLIVLGNLVGDIGYGSVTNNGRAVFTSDFTNSTTSFGGSGETYVFDDTPTIVGFTPTGDESTLQGNDPDLYNFVAGLIGSGCNVTINANTTNADCHGNSTGAINITTSGGTPPHSYSWSTGATSEDLAGIAAGTYDITVTDASACQSTGSYTISQPPAITINLGADQTICEGESVILDAGTGYTNYSWSTGGSARTEIITNSVDITALQTEIVTVTVTDGTGCSGTSSSVTIAIYPSPETGMLYHLNLNYYD